MADNTYQYSQRRPSDRSLRASDQDRDAVGEILRRQHAAGRIDTDEFSERFGRCLAAKTYAQLDELVKDFPGIDGVVGGDPVAAGPLGWQARRGRRLPLAARRVACWPIAWVALVVAATVFTGGHLLWLAFPLFVFLMARHLLWRSSRRTGGPQGGSGWSGPRTCGPGFGQQTL